jgi:phage shock protein PspC (stress-responsive transcriptional regulator)
MTETLPPPPSSGGLPPLPRRLVRRSDEKMVAGVCAAFARATDTDPVLWRIGIVVLSLFGGTGIALYVLGWLLVPKVGGGPTAVERALRQPRPTWAR